MIVSLKIAKLQKVLVYLLLFFSAMNFQSKFFYFAFAAFLVGVVGKRRFKLDNMSLIYLFMGLLMAIYNYNEGILSMIRCFSYFLLYVLAYNLMSIDNDSNTQQIYQLELVEKRAYNLLVILASGAFFHYLLNFITNTNSLMGRNTIDIWSGQIMAATGQAVLASLMVALSVSMILIPKKKNHRWIGVLCIGLVLAYNLMLGGRTIVVLTLILFVVGLWYANRLLQTSAKKLKLMVTLLGLLAVIGILIILNAGGVQDYIFNSNLFQRFGMSLSSFTEESSRTTAKISFLLNAYKYPFGGLYMRDKFGYAHDLLLDGYDEYGCFGLVLLLIVLINGICELLKLLKGNTISSTFKLALLCVYITFLLIFYVEPILAGMHWFFCLYCFVNGCIIGINKSRERCIKNE